jgi:glycosyltransferase involved in cell wall biosynthesis
MPFFSIIIPVYKTEIYLEECLRSVKNQTFTDFECIVINDGSPGVEDLKSVLKNVSPEDQAKYIFENICDGDNRFRFIQKPNEGLGTTKNLGLSQAKGERLLVLDSDDFLETNYLEIAYQNLKNQSLNVINFGLLKTYSDGIYNSFQNSQKFLPKNNNLENLLVFPTWSVTPINYFWRLSLIQKYNIRYRFKNKGEDTAFVIDNILAVVKELKSGSEKNKQLSFEPLNIYYIYRQFLEQMTKSDGFEVELFEHTTSYTKSILQDLREIGLKYEVLGRLFVLRFSIYRQRLLSKNKLGRMILNILAKCLTVLAMLITGTRKA